MKLLLLAAILAVRIVLALASARAGSAREPREPAPVDSASGTLRFVFLWLVVLPFCGWLAIAQPRTLATAVPLGVFAGIVIVWPLARYVLAPLGLVRPAYYVALGSWKATEDKVGTALLTASVALHRRPAFDPAEAAWLEEKIQSEVPLRGGAIAAAASVASARGDRGGARALFRSVRALDPRACTPFARHVASEWLAADAAERGAWEEVLAIGDDPAFAGPAARLLAGVAKRLLGRPGAPGRHALLRLWLLAPRRRRTFPIVERALSVPDGASPLPDDDADALAPEAPAGDALARAIAEHVRLLSMRRPTPADVVRAGRAFDAAFEEGALPAELDRRAEQLGAARAGHALACFREDVEESLFQVLVAHDIALDDTAMDLGVLATSAQRRLRNETLAVIEALSDAVRTRVNERRALPAIDEWREAASLRAAYERGVALGGPELRYLAFTKVHADLCALAVWLFNDRKERPIGNAMFRFLLDEARAVGDTEAIELQTRNTGCGV